MFLMLTIQMIFLIFFLSIAVPIWIVVRWLLELIPEGGDVKKRAILISGCDTGFGHELALKCAKNGFLVFAGCLTDQNPKPKETDVQYPLSPGQTTNMVKEEIQGAENLQKESGGNENLKTVKLDVTKDKDVNDALEYVKNNLNGRTFWAVVNNAGIFSCYGPDDWCKMEDYNLALEVNTLGVIRLTQAFKKLIKQSKGRIITVTSVNGRLSSPCAGPYVVSKFGAEAYMDAIRQELYGFGVQCSVLEPGIFRTPLLDEKAMLDRVNKVWSKLDDETKEEYGEDFKDYFGRFWNKTYLELSTTKTHYVVDNYYHAITAKFPRHRYYCGWDAIFVFVPLSILPTWFSDFAVRAIGKQEVFPACVEKELAKKKQ